MFDFNGAEFPPSSRLLGSNFLEEKDGVFVPPAKRFDDKWLEEDAFSSAIVKMRADLGRLSRINGDGGRVGCSVEKCFLSG